MNESRALAILDKVLKLTQSDAAVATIEGGTEASTRLADNLITQNVEKSDVQLTISCAYGQSHGSVSTSDLSDDALKAAVNTAQTIARSMPPDPEYMPPLDASEADKYSKVDAYREETSRLEPLEKAERLAAAAKAAAKDGLRLSGAYANGERFGAVANSAGLRATHRETTAEIHLTALGDTGSGWAEKISNSVADVDVGDVAARALRIAVTAQNPVDLEPGRYTVILTPAALGELLAFTFWGGFDAKATDEGRTFLKGKLGTKICGENVTVRSDPADPRLPGAPFQDEGLACPVLSWVEGGLLKNLSYSRFWAKKQGAAPTGHPSNIIMDGADTTTEEMIASIERGLLITRFWYIRSVDPMVPLLTGMTRDGLLLIEDGRVRGAVKHMRFNENPVGILNRIEAMGPPTRTGEYMSMLVPTLKVRDFNFTSGTKF